MLKPNTTANRGMVCEPELVFLSISIAVVHLHGSMKHARSKGVSREAQQLQVTDYSICAV